MSWAMLLRKKYGNLIQLPRPKINSDSWEMLGKMLEHPTAQISSPREQWRPAALERSGSWQGKQGKPGWQQHSGLWKALKCPFSTEILLFFEAG